MAYTQNDRCTGGQWLSTGTETAGTTATLLLTNPATGQCHRIKWISISAPAATILNIKVTKNDGTTVLDQFDWAGTANSLTPGQSIMNYLGGLNCAGSDQTKIIVTNTGSGAIVVAAAYDLVPG